MVSLLFAGMARGDWAENIKEYIPISNRAVVLQAATFTRT
jgi:hypothetical protein